MKKIIILSFAFMLTINCAPKRYWTGQHITLQIKNEPKEDFIARGFVVVAYTEFSKNDRSQDVFRFDAYKNNKLARVIECLPWGALKYLVQVDQNPENYQFGICESRAIKHGVNSGLTVGLEPVVEVKGRIYKYYKTFPDYEKIKADVIQVLSGNELVNEK
jgi:hypothetical protein